MQILVKNGFLDSVRGPRGGFTLKGDPEKINLLQIYELIEGSLEEHHCGIETQKCPFISCVFGGLADKFSVEFIGYLRTKTLADLISNK